MVTPFGTGALPTWCPLFRNFSTKIISFYKIHSKGLQQIINRLQKEILELTNVFEPDLVDITTLEQEVTICDESLLRHQEVFPELRAYLTEKTQIVDELEGNMTELKNRIQNILTGKSVPLKEVLTLLQQDVAYAEDERKHYENQLKEYDKKVDVLKKELHRLEAIIDTNMEKHCTIAKRENEYGHSFFVGWRKILLDHFVHFG